jgi:hypothetical protein
VLSSKVTVLSVFTQSPPPNLLSQQRLRLSLRRVFLLSFLVFAAGCNRFKLHHEQHEMVYVWTRQMYLRDRVAAVSNHVAEVTNGEPLEVQEHGHRFLRVTTEKNEMGWIPERAVIDSKTYDAFIQLAAQHKDNPVIATGVLRDDVYLHVTPGRDTDRFYLLPGSTKVQMLVRASIAKGAAPGAPAAAAKHPAPPTAKPNPPAKADNDEIPPPPGEPVTEPLPMEDWWLVRDTQGRAGWVLGNRVDVDVPDDVAQYAEGQRIIGAYIIAKVHDDQANTPNNLVPEYVTALAPPKSGLPFDFDQIRVFTWSLKHHRYETAFRIHPIQGFLPVRISSEPAPGGTEPVFSFQIANSPDVSINPDTGIAKPAQLRTISYALRDTMVKRTGPDMAAIPTMHAPGEKKPVKKHK